MTTKTKTTWRKVKLGEVADLNPTVRLKKGKSYSFIPMEIIDGANKYIEPNSKKRFDGSGTKFSEGDVLFARITPCLEHGKVAVAKGLEEGVGFGSTEYFIFRGKENITNTDFLYYISKINKFKQTAINSMVGVSGRQRARIEAIQNYELNLPTITEQKRIADILSAFDEKIEVNNKINQTLEQMAQAIFKEWFTKSEKLKVKSEKFGNLAGIKYGQGPAASKLKKSGYPVYGANGVIGYFVSYNFSDRQIIVGCRGVVGNVTLTLPQCVVTHNSLIITPRNNRKIFFYYLLKNQNLDAVVGGSAQPQITIRDLEQFELPLPEEKLQDKFESVAGNLEYKRLINFYENQKLASLRDLLLPKLMSEEMRVKI